MENFLSIFKSQFQRGLDGITLDSEFRNLEEWSSMQSLFIIAAVDEHFDVQLKELDFREAVTIRDLKTQVEKYLSNA
ncbi:MAG: acyl carrier protein [Granulosicoccus sp.]|jgi:acyl carrier protein